MCVGRRFTKQDLSESLKGLDSSSNMHCYICGPQTMIEFVECTLAGLHVPINCVHTEKWWWINSILNALQLKTCESTICSVYSECIAIIYLLDHIIHKSTAEKLGPILLAPLRWTTAWSPFQQIQHCHCHGRCSCEGGDMLEATLTKNTYK